MDSMIEESIKEASMGEGDEQGGVGTLKDREAKTTSEENEEKESAVEMEESSHVLSLCRKAGGLNNCPDIFDNNSCNRARPVSKGEGLKSGPESVNDTSANCTSVQNESNNTTVKRTSSAVEDTAIGARIEAIADVLHIEDSERHEQTSNSAGIFGILNRADGMLLSEFSAMGEKFNGALDHHIKQVSTILNNSKSGFLRGTEVRGINGNIALLFEANTELVQAWKKRKLDCSDNMAEEVKVIIGEADQMISKSPKKEIMVDNMNELDEDVVEVEMESDESMEYIAPGSFLYQATEEDKTTAGNGQGQEVKEPEGAFWLADKSKVEIDPNEAVNRFDARLENTEKVLAYKWMSNKEGEKIQALQNAIEAQNRMIKDIENAIYGKRSEAVTKPILSRLETLSIELKDQIKTAREISEIFIKDSEKVAQDLRLEIKRLERQNKKLTKECKASENLLKYWTKRFDGLSKSGQSLLDEMLEFDKAIDEIGTALEALQRSQGWPFTPSLLVPLKRMSYERVEMLENARKLKEGAKFHWFTLVFYWMMGAIAGYVIANSG